MTVGLDLVSLISTVGFPISVTIYLLYERAKREDGQLKEVKAVIQSNTEALAAIKEVIKECTKK